MKAGDKHVSREEMLRAIEGGSIPFIKHLEVCEECATLFRLVKQYSGSDLPAIIKPDKNCIKRFAAIPLYEKIRRDVKPQYGKLVFNSWAQLPAVQLRDVSPGFMRRLCFQAGQIKLEIIAERQQFDWEFTARVYDAGDVSLEWVLVAGRKRLLPGSLGFYQWTSRSKPSRIKLLNSRGQINFERVSWV